MVDEAVWLDLPCPNCGEYALEAEVVLRDVALQVRPGEGGSVGVAIAHADAQLAAAACHACGEEPDLDVQEQLAEALEGAAEAWLSRLGAAPSCSSCSAAVGHHPGSVEACVWSVSPVPTGPPSASCGTTWSSCSTATRSPRSS